MTLSDERLREEERQLARRDERIVTLPAEGEIGIVDIGPLTLESGEVLDDVSIAVQRWGDLSPNRDNVVVALHALTGDSHLTGPAGPGHPTFDLKGASRSRRKLANPDITGPGVIVLSDETARLVAL